MIGIQRRMHAPILLDIVPLRYRKLQRGCHKYRTAMCPSVSYFFVQAKNGQYKPVRLLAILNPVSEVVTTRDTLFAGTKLRVAVVPSEYSTFIH
jgi:hypothetical protein